MAELLEPPWNAMGGHKGQIDPVMLDPAIQGERPGRPQEPPPLQQEVMQQQEEHHARSQRVIRRPTRCADYVMHDHIVFEALH